MLDGGDGFADELVALLADAPVGLSCVELARRTGRRKADVLETLRWDPRVRHEGRGRGSRWRVTATMTASAPREQKGTTDRGARDHPPVPAGEDGREAAVIPGQTTVYEMPADAQVPAG
jgi:hypothetical protein